MKLIDYANQLEPNLDWIESWSIFEQSEQREFVGATVGLKNNYVGTVTLARLGEHWVSELIIRAGHFQEPSGELYGTIGSKAAASPEEAWNGLLKVATALCSLDLGILAAQQAIGIPKKEKLSKPESGLRSLIK